MKLSSFGSEINITEDLITIERSHFLIRILHPYAKSKKISISDIVKIEIVDKSEIPGLGNVRFYVGGMIDKQLQFSESLLDDNTFIFKTSQSFEVRQALKPLLEKVESNTNKQELRQPEQPMASQTKSSSNTSPSGNNSAPRQQTVTVETSSCFSFKKACIGGTCSTCTTCNPFGFICGFCGSKEKTTIKTK